MTRQEFNLLKPGDKVAFSCIKTFDYDPTLPSSYDDSISEPLTVYKICVWKASYLTEGLPMIYVQELELPIPAKYLEMEGRRSL